MFCTKCGIQVATNTSFCTKCGAAIVPQLSTKSDDVSAISTRFFFTTSTLKLILMSICTFGIYDLFWFYKNWVLIKERTGQNIMPFWRAFFSPIWAYSCFEQIETFAKENNIQKSLPIVFLAVLYFILQGLWRLPDPYWLISFFSFVPIIPANILASNLNKYLIPEFQNNKNFTGWNWVGLILGGIIFILSIFGTFVPLAE